MRYLPVLALALAVAACGGASESPAPPEASEATSSPIEALPTWSTPAQLTQGIEVNSVQYLSNGELLFTSNDSVMTAKADGTEVRTLFSFAGIRRANMRPNGNEIVLDTDLDIFTTSPDGSDVKLLADDPNVLEFAVSFTPDGSAITFVTIDDVKSTYGIWIMDPEGNSKESLRVSTDEIFRHPRQSPSGKSISYFTVSEGRQPTIWVMDTDGENSVALTDEDVDGPSRQASWSPDGKQFVYSAKKGSDFDIWTMESDGTKKTQITSVRGDEGKPVWGPDGQSIVFVCSGCQGGEGSDLYRTDRVE